MGHHSSSCRVSNTRQVSEKGGIPVKLDGFVKNTLNLKDFLTLKIAIFYVEVGRMFALTWSRRKIVFKIKGSWHYLGKYF